MKQVIISILAIGMLAGCNYITDLKRVGDETTLNIGWSGAGEIEIEAPVRLILVNSETPSLQLTGMDFIVEGYDLIQEDHKLIIRHQNVNWLQDSKIADLYVYSTDFNRITANAPCQITSNNDTLIINQLSLVVNGKGIYTTSDLIVKGNSLSISVYGGINKSQHILAGQVNKATYHIQGGTDMDALALATQNTTVIHKSYGDCYLNATDQLQVTIFSTGNVYYTGTPELTFEQRQNTVMTSTGKAIPF
jgi:DNA polymerase III psi subunit